MKKDVEFMQLALEQAKQAMAILEVPIGCVIVDEENVVISSAYNKVENHKDAMSHAEILALKKASQVVGDWRLTGATLYTTVEPCLMCSGAVILSRVKRVVYGCKDARHGGAGSLTDLFALDHPIHKVDVVGGVLENEARELLQKFFHQRRREKCLHSKSKIDCLKN